jgi:hypothetical protein
MGEWRFAATKVKISDFWVVTTCSQLDWCWPRLRSTAISDVPAGFNIMVDTNISLKIIVTSSGCVVDNYQHFVVSCYLQIHGSLIGVDVSEESATPTFHLYQSFAGTWYLQTSGLFGRKLLPSLSWRSDRRYQRFEGKCCLHLQDR